MKNYSVRMIRENMENIPEFPIPEGFVIRNYRRNEGHIWTRIQKAAEPYIDIDDGLFDRQFKRNLSAMEDLFWSIPFWHSLKAKTYCKKC